MQGAGALVLGWQLPSALAGATTATAGDTFAPNAFLSIDGQGRVTVYAKHVEMGQGAYTGLATLVAEELDADWSQVRVEGAPADTERYKNLAMGIQGTGGSTAMSNSFQQMREAGAAARAMLVAAAAQAWKADPATITVRAGVVSHAASKRQAGFGELAAAAAQQPVPAKVRVKTPAEFSLIGKPLHRTDSADKVHGRALFTQDVRLPGMLVAVAAHAPRFGATVAKYDASAALAVPGVVAAIPFEGSPYRSAGVAVLARNTWAARTGRDALKVEWDESQAYAEGSDELLARYRKAASRPGTPAANRGNVDRAFEQAARVIEADYEFPYLAHASMEPLNCVVHLRDGQCEIWNGEQFQTMDQKEVAEYLGIPPERVKINQLYAGGSFGRRANTHADYIVEAVAIASGARKTGIDAPIKLVWTREDDMRAGYYRPLYLHRARLALDKQGRLQAWQVRIVGQSLIKGTVFESGMVKNGIDATSVEGLSDLAYRVPNLRVELHTPEDARVPVQWYRSVGHTHTAFSAETLIDEAAHAAQRDPVQLRRELLQGHPRHLAALDLAVRQAGWDRPLAAGKDGVRRGRGVAVHESFNTVVAQVVEISVDAEGGLKVDRVVCAVACGLAINPDVVKAQMEGGIGFALSMALHGAITLDKGAVVQSNFHDYPVLRMNEMPRVEVHIVPSQDPPTGVGEPGVPPLAPALANAVFAVTGERVRALPIRTPLRKSA
ncbi:MAG: xanthine dehydrogenase family protein molybdopterin-binding subunit [Pigmentiphaga sp.]|nr:xanthine dehydrogenase family protein molybdopterin-binding subunit [Pigmentiphaga sp.]MDX3907189.1 xanthine dehydrogenase family protein molybdopterin-binding subunit [Pigmentiphaga sp.]